MAISKRMRATREKVTPGKAYPALEALQILKELPPVKFDQSVELCVNLGIDVRKSDQTVRGATVLPHGSGKQVKVAVFAQGANAEAAKAAGADAVGFEDLAESMKGGQLDYHVVIASPDAMRIVGQLGQLLGPRGLMPNPKVGTVTADVANAVKNAKSGQVRYRADKNGIIHCTIGKLSFDAKQLLENLDVLLADLKKAKPSSSKGIYMKKITLSSTMGPGIVVDSSTLASV